MFPITFGVIFFSENFLILNTRGDPSKNSEFLAKNFLSSQIHINIITSCFCRDKTIPVVKNYPKLKVKAV